MPGFMITPFSFQVCAFLFFYNQVAQKGNLFTMRDSRSHWTVRIARLAYPVSPRPLSCAPLDPNTFGQATSRSHFNSGIVAFIVFDSLQLSTVALTTRHRALRMARPTNDPITIGATRIPLDLPCIPPLVHATL